MITSVPTEAIIDQQLEANDVRVLGYLCRYAPEYPSFETIAQRLKMSKKTVTRATQKLHELGYLYTTKERGRVNQYHVIFDRQLGTPGNRGRDTRELGRDTGKPVLGTPGNQGRDTRELGRDTGKPVNELHYYLLNNNNKNKQNQNVSNVPTLPEDILFPEMFPIIQDRVKHSSVESLLSTIRRWQTIFTPTVIRQLYEVMENRPEEATGTYWNKCAQNLQAQELREKPQTETIDKTQKREFLARCAQVDERRQEGEDEGTIREYLRRSQENYPLNAEALRKEARWEEIVGGVSRLGCGGTSHGEGAGIR